MIDIQGLTKRFGAYTAVSNLSLHVGKGEVLGFLGPNGAGKSTTMKIVTGFLAPTAGRVQVCGHDVETDELAAQEVIGYLPEGAPRLGRGSKPLLKKPNSRVFSTSPSKRCPRASSAASGWRRQSCTIRRC